MELKYFKDPRDKLEDDKNVICFQCKKTENFRNKCPKLEKEIFRKNGLGGNKKWFMCIWDQYDESFYE